MQSDFQLRIEGAVFAIVGIAVAILLWALDKAGIGVPNVVAIIVAVLAAATIIIGVAILLWPSLLRLRMRLRWPVIIVLRALMDTPLDLPDPPLPPQPAVIDTGRSSWAPDLTGPTHTFTSLPKPVAVSQYWLISRMTGMRLGLWGPDDLHLIFELEVRNASSRPLRITGLTGLSFL